MPLWLAVNFNVDGRHKCIVPLVMVYENYLKWKIINMVERLKYLPIVRELLIQYFCSTSDTLETLNFYNIKLKIEAIFNINNKGT